MEALHILVTGGCGYIGSHTCRMLLDLGHEVTVIDDLSTGHADALNGARLIEGKIGDEQALAAAADKPFHAVLHFAGRSLVGESVGRPELYYRENIVESARFLEWLTRHGAARRFVFSSSAAVYGDSGEAPLGEDAPLRPVNPYGLTKVAIEGMLAGYARAHDWAAVALRYFNAAGAHPEGLLGERHDPETHLIGILAKNAAAARYTAAIFGDDWPTPDRTPIRDFIHVWDLAAAHVKALEWTGHNPRRFLPCNVGTGKGTSVEEVVRAFEAYTGKLWRREARPRRDGDPAVLVADAACSSRELGFTPRRSDIAAIVADACRWEERQANRA